MSSVVEKFLRYVKTAPVLGFIAHMDTSMAISGRDVKPRIVENACIESMETTVKILLSIVSLYSEGMK